MIIGKIARIFDAKEVVINRGKEHGVKKGMEFVIYTEGDHVFDPETNEDLGVIETVKGRVVVTHVMEKMSRAKTKSYEVTIEPKVISMSAMLLGQSRTERFDNPLKVYSDELKPITEDLTVRTGDLVRQVE